MRRALVGILLFSVACVSRTLPLTDDVVPTDGGVDVQKPQDLKLADGPDMLFANKDMMVTPGGDVGAACTPSASGMDKGSCKGALDICYGEDYGFPGGYCTRECDAKTPCPSGSVCLDTGNGFTLCFATCGSTGDCRDSYQCTPDGNPNESICYPGQPTLPPGTNNGNACVTPAKSPSPGYFGSNLKVSGNGHFAIEPSMALDADNKKVLVAWYDYSQNGDDTLKYAFSSDGGATFATPGTLSRGTNPPPQYIYYPSTGFDGTYFYVAWLGYDTDASGAATNMKVYLGRGQGGPTWEYSVVTPKDEWTDGGSLDAPRLAVAPDHALWMTWTRYDAATGLIDIRAARSTDHGASWSPVVTVSESELRTSASRSYAVTAFTPSGESFAAHVAWVEIAGDYFGSVDNAIYLQTLNPGGSLQGKNVRVSSPGDSPGYDWPSIASDLNTVWVAFSSGTPAGAWDIRLAEAAAGLTLSFGPSQKVNDDKTCATHFHAAVAAAPASGVAHVIYYDNRYLVGNVFHTYVKSAGGGMFVVGDTTFVNDKSFPFTTSQQDGNALADYVGLIVAGNSLYATWTDGRAGNTAAAYFAKGSF